MNKKIKIKGLDCANCALKVEDAVKKIEGVNACSVNFMTEKMTLDFDETNQEVILQEVVSVCKKVEPDVILKV